MIRLGVVGLGTIFSVQRRALERLDDRYQITAVCDVLPEKLRDFETALDGLSEARKPKLYGDSTDLFADPNVDAVLIATPPATHYALARDGLTHGKHILLEKPAVLEYAQLESLYALAGDVNRLLHIAYHASFAKDLEWFLRHADELALGEIATIECGFYDPYMENGRVIPGKRPLGGCFIDSGVNALSVCARLTDLSGFRLSSAEELTEPDTDLVYHADHVFENDKCRVIIHTGWDLGLNQKTSMLSFSGTDRQLWLHHSDQSVYLLDGERKERLFRYDATERLLTHYLGVFRGFEEAYRLGETNKRSSETIHRLLLEGLEG